ncbi:MAG: hypothetical protein IJA89_03085, partial [Clostridia bacterium]|nr:hypothetical protein [Clostridia bacterium]
HFSSLYYYDIHHNKKSRIAVYQKRFKIDTNRSTKTQDSRWLSCVLLSAIRKNNVSQKPICVICLTACKSL